MTLAQAAQKAIELGGKFDGHELPEDINAFTKTSATALAGQGLMGVARDTYPRDGTPFSFVAGFAEVEVDVETGQYQLLDYLGGRRRRHGDPPAQPRRPDSRPLDARHRRTRIGQKWVYDQHYGVPLATRFYQNKPPTILDAPRQHAVGRRSTFRIPRRRSARAASANRRWRAGCCAVLNALIGRGRRRGRSGARRSRRHDPDVARSRPSRLRDADGQHLTLSRPMGPEPVPSAVRR